VRTIVEDFHDGTARAENLPGGGARFTLCLKSMETAEAKIG
jgi:signal transduction histidine kinase